MAMKKIAKFIFAAVAMTAAVSCVKELDQVRPVEMTGKAYVFSASFDAETKTVLDEETLVPMWLGNQDGDEFITVMEPGSVNTYVAEGIYEPTAEVTFVMAENGGPGLKGNAAFAVSPAGAWSCFNTADSVGVTVNFSNKQYAYNGTYDPAAPVAVAYNNNIEANPNFSFKNVSALLKFKIHSDSDPVNSVKIYALGGEALAGKMHLMEKADSAKIVPADTLATNWVEMEGLYGAPLEVETTYYIAVAPALLKNGIAIQFNNNEVETYTISKELNIQRNRIYDLGMFSYESSDDNNWYVIGNFVEGNANNISKTMFEESGNNLVAKNVTFAEGQSFKIYNPALGQAFYVNADKVSIDTWIDLTDEEGFVGVEAEGVYDIYIDYATGLVIEQVYDEEWDDYYNVVKEANKITGVAVVKSGSDVPEYLSPAGFQYTWVDADEQCTRVMDLGVTEEGTFRMGRNYDEITGLEFRDPDLEGAWMLEGSIGTEYFIERKHATSGYIIAKLVTSNPAYGDMVEYVRIEYSNITESSIDAISTWREDLFTPLYDEDGNPVYDEYGDQVTTTSSLAIVSYDESYNLQPATLTKSKDVLDILIPMPDEGLYHVMECMDENGEYMRLIDLNLEEGYLRFADNYDVTVVVPGDYDWDTNTIIPGYSYSWPKEGMHTNKWFVSDSYKINKYEVIPSDAMNGQIRLYAEDDNNNPKYFLINYMDYTYGTMIGLMSDVIVTDLNGNMIPVDGGSGAYWEGIGVFAYAMSVSVSEDVDESTMRIEEVPETPENTQWAFKWEANRGILSYLDFGVSEDGKFTLGYDADEAHGDDPTLPEEWKGKAIVMAGPADYKIIPGDNAGCGTIELSMVDPYFGETITTYGEYTGYNGGMMYVTLKSLGLIETPVTLVQNLPEMFNPYAIGM